MIPARRSWLRELIDRLLRRRSKTWLEDNDALFEAWTYDEKLGRWVLLEKDR